MTLAEVGINPGKVDLTLSSGPSEEVSKETTLFWTLMTPVTLTGKAFKAVLLFTFIEAPLAILKLPLKVANFAKEAIFGSRESTQKKADSTPKEVEELPEIEELPAEVLQTPEPSSDSEAAAPAQPEEDWEARFNAQPVVDYAQREAAMARLLSPVEEQQQAPVSFAPAANQHDEPTAAEWTARPSPKQVHLKQQAAMKLKRQAEAVKKFEEQLSQPVKPEMIATHLDVASLKKKDKTTQPPLSHLDLAGPVAKSSSPAVDKETLLTQFREGSKEFSKNMAKQALARFRKNDANFQRAPGATQTKQVELEKPNDATPSLNRSLWEDFLGNFTGFGE